MAQAQTKTKHVGIEEDDENLTSALPTREGWWEPFFLVQGFWLSPSITKSVTALLAQFRPRRNDIILATYPKCGTTWLKALAFKIVNRSNHPVVTGYGHPLFSHNPHDLVPDLERPCRHLHPVTELDELPYPRLLSTHLPLALLPSSTFTLGWVVYLCREPKDVLVSVWYHIKKVRPNLFIEFDRAFEFFCEGFSFYGPIWEHYLGYWKQSKMEPEKVLFLKYDEMIAEPTKHVKMLAEFLRVPFTDEEGSRGAVEEACTPNLASPTQRHFARPMMLSVNPAALAAKGRAAYQCPTDGLLAHGP
ncbi:cytosolic sulfotransferase 5-like [Panicum miliaceum]|uniref:Sulfotransferase n=1 Tax=Panicum miliaceum TaxID=4540 RepID=A0A3L6Q2Z3_PANMI|nr:cytosolic sulfotransferase 5-like [Panicum miliaceum]